MEQVQQLLQVSAKLYKHLTNEPKEALRDEYIEVINKILNERGILIANLQTDGFQFDSTNKSHQMLAELDKGIKMGLSKILELIKTDLRDLQNAKKNEKQYLNPYASVSVMDGRYYDGKK